MSFAVRIILMPISFKNSIGFKGISIGKPKFVGT